jgi:ubiquitin C-terminal hydrolase
MEDNKSVRTYFSGKGANGLMNIGNSCYINTTIQCLGHCISFLHFILMGKYEREEGSLISELRELFVELWIKDNGVIPNRFLKYLRTHLRDLNLCDQHDVQEFLTLFIDKLNRSISVKIDVDDFMSHINYENTQYDKLRKKVDKAWYGSMKNEYSPLIDYLYGQSVIQIICGNCQKIHHNYEPFSNLLLPIPHNQNGLIDCLKAYAVPEQLNENGSDWKCDGCNRCEKSLKTMKFWRLPNILAICLKRFTYDLKKNNTVVQIPETLDMTDFVIGQTHAKYEICSIACHIGNFFNGHYYAICKNPNGKWFRIDDTNVYELKNDFETPSNVYMVFYQKTNQLD